MFYLINQQLSILQTYHILQLTIYYHIFTAEYSSDLPHFTVNNILSYI